MSASLGAPRDRAQRATSDCSASAADDEPVKAESSPARRIHGQYTSLGRDPGASLVRFQAQVRCHFDIARQVEAEELDIVSHPDQTTDRRPHLTDKTGDDLRAGFLGEKGEAAGQHLRQEWLISALGQATFPGQDRRQ